MSLHLHREMEKLNRTALEMCAWVEQNVRDAAQAFLERDIDLSGKVIEADAYIDKMEVELSESCLKTLALYQPVAGDLRFIFSLSKIAGILERIGDLAENLANKGKSLARMEPVAIPQELADMADHARVMLRDSIDSFVDRDTVKAKRVLKADAAVNRGKRRIRKIGEAAIMETPSLCSQWLVVISASRNIERMADMAANVAAEVIYSVDGKMVRHGFDCE
ncbi:MAG: phosphate signaling complex protein PhoU [Planctomycetaceae bacterium]|nr:phosphate signaling complex protein PhoU [Planctomycetaceae bacterium]